ncbi:MAG: Hsp20/alpha crystallin family protein [Planctomycetota bacterium]|nr:Hsp20/alpha crystallin family protein [Planctomycetota bacterium]
MSATNGITRRTAETRPSVSEFGLITPRLAGFGPFAGGPFGTMLRDFFNDPFFNEVEAQPSAGVLPLDVSEDDTHLIVRASLPGYAKEEVTAEVNDGVLTIVGTKTEDKTDEKEGKGERYFRRERRVGTVSRSVSLPEGVDTENVNAELKDGVLTLRLAKTPKAQPRRINIG